MTEHTDAAAKQAEAAKKKLAEDREAREKARNERIAEEGKVKPTPTQDENDLAALGVHGTEHEPDGSPPDPNDPSAQPKSREAKPSQQSSRGDYQTRAAAPAHTAKHE
ncbi:hypothetical protein [Bradyrhizobium sp. AZCC 2289]|uniref:hypothetical protein n=1 Tax=Bradyrhizobium sp. AZCC 2289 TaxID=3117026 RepID=UPI002FF03F9F